MIHAAHAPPAPLAHLVQSLWIQEEPAVDEPVEPTVLLPVGHAALVFEYGDPFEELGADGVARRLAPVVLARACTRPVRVRALGRTGLVIVPFRPWGAAAFFPGAAEGWDEGAYAALFAALSRLDCFGGAVAQSLFHGSSQGQGVLEELVRSASVLPAVALDWGRYDPRCAFAGVDTIGWSRALASALRARGARVVERSANDGDQCAFWRARLSALLAGLLPE